MRCDNTIKCSEFLPGVCKRITQVQGNIEQDKAIYDKLLYARLKKEERMMKYMPQIKEDIIQGNGRN